MNEKAPIPEDLKLRYEHLSSYKPMEVAVTEIYVRDWLVLIERIAALQAEVDALKATNRAMNRRIGLLEHAVSTQSERGAFERYFKCASRLWSEADAEITALKAQLATAKQVAADALTWEQEVRHVLKGRLEELKAEVARRSAPVTEELYEDGRCQVCGWPLSKTVADGCVPESCSMRPREGSEDWFRLKERRAWLAARATPPQDVENGGKQ